MSRVTQIFRFKAIVPLVLVLLIVAFAWALLVDRVIERSIESFGSMLVGASVDLAEADLRIREGSLVLRGLEVTNPDRPMTNLVVAEEIVADLALRALVEKKIVIDTMALRGVRFGTERQTSGALERPSEASEQTRGLIAQWAGRVRVPPLSFEGLSSAVDVGALSPDSLRSLQEARSVIDRAESFKADWEAALVGLDPRPHIDSARSLVAQLQNFNPLRLGPTGIANLVTNSRNTLTSLEAVRSDLGGLDSTTRAGVAQLQASVATLDDAQRIDYAYARGLMQLPSLSAPDLSTSIFGDAVVQWARPVLYWMQVVEQVIPPGLDPRNRPGRDRARRAGTDVSFPGRSVYPAFLVRHGEVSLELGGAGPAAGKYAALVRGFTTEPAVYGSPTEISVSRTGGEGGTSAIDGRAVLDHVAAPTSDSVGFTAEGIMLPSLDLAPLGARLEMGEGNTRLAFGRTGETMSLLIGWEANSVGWVRTGDSTPEGGQVTIGTRAWAEDLLWRTISGLRQVRVDVEFGGTLDDPTLGVTSNVGDAISQALQRELGREIERAEQRLRAEVDALVSQEVARARVAVRTLANEMSQRIGIPLAELDAVEAELREELARRIPE